jgi:hypothetical protein
MPYNDDLANRVRAALGTLCEITEKKMFGGLAFMLNGNMCVGVTNDDLMVRVGTAEHETLLALPHARPMDFTGRPMKGFVFVGLEGIEKAESLKEWLGRGVSFAQTLPKK